MSDVLGILTVAQHAVTQAEDHPLVAVDQQARRLRITSLERLDQRGVIHRHLALPAGRPAGRLPPAGRLSPIIPQPRQSGFTIRSGRTETDAKRDRIATWRRQMALTGVPARRSRRESWLVLFPPRK